MVSRRGEAGFVVRRSGGKTIVTMLQPAESSNWAAINDQLRALFNEGQTREVLLDLGGVQQLGSSDLTQFMSLNRKISAAGGQLTLCNLGREIHDIFVATRLDQVLTIRTESEPTLTSHHLDCSATEDEHLYATFARHGIVSRSSLMLDVLRSALAASRFGDLPVLITGETGTGKELLAKAIHALDVKRHSRMFLAFNCSCVSQSLAESDLFGHVKGAFTGAERARLGVFRAAHGGTLLLDEIGDLHLQLQPKLLRVLEERRLLPVGADYEHEVDVRVIAATNRPLEQMLAAGQFRNDLFERLNVLRIHIPPLRQRPEDIELQARHFLTLYQVGSSQPAIDFSEQALEALRRRHWGGNTRQLQNMIRETLACRRPGPRIDIDDLPRWVIGTIGDRAGGEPAATTARTWSTDGQETSREEPATVCRSLAELLFHHGTSLDSALAEFERQLLCIALQHSDNNRTKAATSLGLTRQGLLKKLKKYSL